MPDLKGKCEEKESTLPPPPFSPPQKRKKTKTKMNLLDMK